MSEVVRVDLNDEKLSQEVVQLLDGYANDFFGGNEPLSKFSKENIIIELRKLTSVHVFMAKLLASNEYVGLAICFEGFSTFECKPLINIHDFYVKPEARRQGISFELISFIEQFGRSKGYCKITLEVLEGNLGAKAAYTSAGFDGYELDPTIGKAEFWQKKIQY
mmetsp:Transcript_15347/g.14720  ORF Transcript_15347/g.14720 Transcript_15347/m.14720 type:complete len:164 (+) Transcript_15347:63-554(+)